MKKSARAPKRTVRCPNIRSGMVALSARRHCNTLKAMIKRPNAAIKPMILLEDQERLKPPHCSARNKQLKAPSSSATPKGSKCFSFSMAGRLFISFLHFQLEDHEDKTEDESANGQIAGIGQRWEVFMRLAPTAMLLHHFSKTLSQPICGDAYPAIFMP